MAAKKTRRFFLKAGFILVIILASVFFLIKNGIAGRYLLRILGNKMKIELNADDVKMTSDGRLNLTRFSVALKDENQPFFTAREISILIDNIPEMLYSFDPNITKIQLISPMLTLQADERGQLNIEPLLLKIKENSSRTAQTKSFPLPALSILNGTFHYERPGKETLSVSHIDAESLVRDGIIQSTLSLPEKNYLSLTVDSNSLDHHIKLHIENVPALPALLRAQIPETLKIDAEWQGRAELLRPWQIDGNLNITNLTLNDIIIALQASAVITQEQSVAQIKHLCLNPQAVMSPQSHLQDDILVTEGRLTYNYAAGGLDVQNLKVLLLQGRAAVDATLFPRDWFQSRAEIQINGIHLASILAPSEFQDATLTGTLQMEPANQKRAMEPMAVSLSAKLDGAIFDRVALQEIVATGYLGATRLVTESAVVPVLGGTAMPWISLTRRNNGIFTHIIADFKDIDADLLARLLTDEQQMIPGVLSGTIRGRTSGDLQTFSGDADITLTDSDLIQTDIISTLYSVMNLATGQADKKGRGRAKLSAQGEKIDVMSFKYFDRGVDIRGAGTIESFIQGRNSPISGFLTGSVRPLQKTGIPGTQELDRLISSLQAGITSIKVEGTLGDPEPKVVPMPEIYNAFRSLLVRQRDDESSD